MSTAKMSVEHFDGEGLKRVVESGSWFVGIKNWKPANDVGEFDCMERHLATDEVFVLLEGGCTLLVDHAADDSCTDIRCIPMRKNAVYCIHPGVWHNTITTRDAKLILMENRDTSMDNSEVRSLSAGEIAALRQRI